MVLGNVNFQRGETINNGTSEQQGEREPYGKVSILFIAISIHVPMELNLPKLRNWIRKR